jgi:hypothetical protein
MRRIISLVVVALVMAALMAASAVPVFAQGALVVPCSDFYGEEVTGVIVFAPDFTPNQFACQGGPFP